MSSFERLLYVWEELGQVVLEARWYKEAWDTRVVSLHHGIKAVYFLESLYDGDDLFYMAFAPVLYKEVGGMPLPVAFRSREDKARYEETWLGYPPLGKMEWEGDESTVSVWQGNRWITLFEEE